jgi:hypothetical protein
VDCPLLASRRDVESKTTPRGSAPKQKKETRPSTVVLKYYNLSQMIANGDENDHLRREEVEEEIVDKFVLTFRALTMMNSTTVLV